MTSLRQLSRRVLRWDRYAAQTWERHSYWVRPHGDMQARERVSDEERRRKGWPIPDRRYCTKKRA